MTPLAYDLLKGLTGVESFKLAVSDSGERQRLWDSITDTHFFDLSSVMPLAHDLAAKLQDAFDDRGVYDETLAFLPAERTWIEAGRHAWMLWGQSDCQGSAKLASPANDPGGSGWWVADYGDIPLRGSPPRSQSQYVDFLVYAMLALINSPRVIGRRQHMPHRRIEREILARSGLRGKFPLHAWTEINLRLTPPKEETGEHEAHLTGERCLHFCRSHLRVKMGRLEVVRAHWRGDASLGIKQSRYKLTA